MNAPRHPDRATLVETARDSIKRGSKSFSFASRLFDQPVRERAWLLYSWCRRCDDLADGQNHGGALDPGHDTKAALDQIRTLTDRALAGEATGDAAFDALGCVAAECAIPRRYIDDLIDGFALDADDWRPQTQADLLRYCYHVAGTVGCMMAIIMGVDADDSETIGYANDLGLAFQLANIARDIAEDAAGGRCYIPKDWLEEQSITAADLTDPAHRRVRAALGQRLASMAAYHEDNARIGARRLPFRSRWAVLAAAGIYGGIAREVAARGQSAWDARVTTSKATKLAHVATAFVVARSQLRAA